MKITNAILFGFGHHGRNRLFPSLLALPQIKKVTVCDIDPKKLQAVEKSNHIMVETTDNMDIAFKGASGETLLVIGTTAKDHLKLLKKTAFNNVKNVYMEKPLVQSMADLDEMAALLKTHSIQFAAGYYNDYLTLTGILETIKKENNLGSLLKISSEGGAVCMSTNGSHVIDLAQVLFRSAPKEIYGRINSRIPGPRGDAYLIHDGMAYSLFDGGRELLLCFNNHSINAHSIRLHFEYGYLDAGYFTDAIKVFGYKADLRNQAKFRYEIPEALISYSIKDDLKTFIGKIFLNFMTGGIFCDFERAYRNTATLLGILISDKMKKPITFPIEKDNLYYHERFPIT
jgi:predicted dehydrogenase